MTRHREPPEPGQSRASADALHALMVAGDRTSDARIAVARLRRDLRAATAELRAAETAERAADRVYMDTPYADTTTDTTTPPEASR